MLKGLIVCFAVLFAQLAVLHVIDARIYNSPQDARQTAVTSVKQWLSSIRFLKPVKYNLALLATLWRRWASPKGRFERSISRIFFIFWCPNEVLNKHRQCLQSGFNVE